MNKCLSDTQELIEAMENFQEALKSAWPLSDAKEIARTELYKKELKQWKDMKGK